MHIVLLNQAFHPDVVATAQMSKDLADELVARGHRVTAVASRSIYGRSGAVLPRRETVDGIEVRRVGASLFGKAGYAARIADFGLFYALAVARVLTLEKPDIVVSFTTPPFIALGGLLARWVRGTKAVYWVMDLYPDLPVACGVMPPRGRLTNLFEGLNRFLLRRSDVAVVLGRCMRDRVLSKGVPAERVRLIPVWAETTGLAPVPHDQNPYRREWGLDGRFVVMYSGNFGIGHDAATICRAMELLKDDHDIRFEFVGGGKRRSEVEAFIRERGLRNAAWREYQPRERLGASLSAGDLHLISLREGVEGIMVPSKLFGIMAVARPSIFVGHPESEIARVLTETGSGIVVREGDAQGLAEAIRGLKSDPGRCEEMGRRGRESLLGRYDSRTACRAWAELLEGLASGRSTPETGAVNTSPAAGVATTPQDPLP